MELDILLNNFLDAGYDELDTKQKTLFESMLEYPDQVLFDLLMGKMMPASQKIGNLVALIRSAIT